MCGIYGYANLQPNKAGLDAHRLKYAISLLAILNMERGTDSTGLLTIDRNQHIDTVRKTKDSTAFLTHANVRRHVQENLSHETAVVLGHTRFATTGGVTIRNAQPFVCGTIAGTHNGILSNWEAVRTRYALPQTTDVDSEVLFRLAERAQTLDEFVTLLGTVQGSYAVAQFDTRQPDSITFYRNHNPLTVGYCARSGYLLWSSEEEHLNAVNATFDLQLEPLDLPSYELLQISGKHKLTRRVLERSYYAGYSTWQTAEESVNRKTLVDASCEACGSWKRVKWSAYHATSLCRDCRKKWSKTTPVYRSKYGNTAGRSLYYEDNYIYNDGLKGGL